MLQVAAPKVPSPPAPVLPIVPDPIDAEPFFPPEEVQHRAEMLLPFDPDLIPGGSQLVGQLKLALKINRRGEVREIAVLEAVDPGGKMLATLEPWLRKAPFQPARRQGVTVNSILHIRLNLAPVDHGDINYKARRASGQPIWMDERGKVIQ